MVVHCIHLTISISNCLSLCIHVLCIYLCIHGECLISPCIRWLSLYLPCIRKGSVRSPCISQGSSVYRTRSVLDTRERDLNPPPLHRPSGRLWRRLRVFDPLAYSLALLSSSGAVVYGVE